MTWSGFLKPNQTLFFSFTLNCFPSGMELDLGLEHMQRKRRGGRAQEEAERGGYCVVVVQRAAGQSLS